MCGWVGVSWLVHVCVSARLCVLIRVFFRVCVHGTKLVQMYEVVGG